MKRIVLAIALLSFGFGSVALSGEHAGKAVGKAKGKEHAGKAVGKEHAGSAMAGSGSEMEACKKSDKNCVCVNKKSHKISSNLKDMKACKKGHGKWVVGPKK